MGGVSVGTNWKSPKYDIGNRSGMEGRRESARNGKKGLNCTSIGWNTLILSFTRPSATSDTIVRLTK